MGHNIAKRRASTMVPAVRDLLARLKKPWTHRRRMYWLSFLLVPLLGRKISCRVCGTVITRGFIRIQSGRVLVFHRPSARFRIRPDGPFRIAFECVGGCHYGQASSHIPDDISPEQPPRVLHIILGHQKADYLERYIEHHRKLASGYSFLLIHGGDRQDFDALNFAHKVFCDDPSLRGPARLQSLTSALFLAKEAARLQFSEKTFSHVFFSEADHWALQHSYIDPLVAALEQNHADFGAAWLDDVTDTNDTHLADALAEGSLPGTLASAAGCLATRYWHALGSSFLWSWGAFVDVASQCAKGRGCFFEIFIPTLSMNRGFRGVNLSASKAYRHVRFRPAFSPCEVVGLAARGVRFIHPLKAPPTISFEQIDTGAQFRKLTA